MAKYFLFKIPDSRYRKAGWHRARWVATLGEIERLGGRVIGPPEVRGDGDGGGQTAGHAQLTPRQSPRLAIDLTGAAEWRRQLRAETPSHLPGDGPPGVVRNSGRQRDAGRKDPNLQHWLAIFVRPRHSAEQH
jgi:hypothetical protein